MLRKRPPNPSNPYGLEDRRWRFCQELLIDDNAAQAAIRAGYSERTAKQQACRLLTNADVRRAVADLRAARAQRLEITADRVLQELAMVAFAASRPPGTTRKEAASRSLRPMPPSRRRRNRIASRTSRRRPRRTPRRAGCLTARSSPSYIPRKRSDGPARWRSQMPGSSTNWRRRARRHPGCFGEAPRGCFGEARRACFAF